MPVTPLRHDQLLACHRGRHFASEPHLRIQVVPIRPEQNQRELFAFHGELLLICLRGDVSVRTGETSHPLGERDQLLLVDGEPFAVESSGAEDALVQFVWTPGPNPCKTCRDAPGQGGAADT